MNNTTTTRLTTPTYNEFDTSTTFTLTTTPLPAKLESYGFVSQGWIHTVNFEGWPEEIIGEHTFRADGLYGAAANIDQAHHEAIAEYLERIA